MPLQWDFDGLCGVDCVESEFYMLQQCILRNGIILGCVHDYDGLYLPMYYHLFEKSTIMMACLWLCINHLFEKLL